MSPVCSGCPEVPAGAGKVDGVNHIGFMSPLHRMAYKEQHKQGQSSPIDNSCRDSHLLPKHTVPGTSADLAGKSGHNADGFLVLLDRPQYTSEEWQPARPIQGLGLAY